MNITLEIDYDDYIYTVDATVTDGEASTYEDAGSPPEIEVWSVYNEVGCELTSNIDYKMYHYFEDLIFDEYTRLTE